jgi:hypothetical protein
MERERERQRERAKESERERERREREERARHVVLCVLYAIVLSYVSYAIVCCVLEGPAHIHTRRQKKQKEEKQWDLLAAERGYFFKNAKAKERERGGGRHALGGGET